MKIYRLLFGCLVTLMTVAGAYGQQPAQYSLFSLNPYAYNSAYGGLDESLVLTGVFRKQWVDIPGAPTTLHFNAHLPLNYLNSGVGVGVEYDVLGAESNAQIHAAYNYIFSLGQTSRLSVGVRGTYLQRGIDGTVLRAPDGFYNSGNFDPNDDFIPVGRETASTFSLGGGVYFKDERLELGLGFRHLNNPATTLVTSPTNSVSIDYNQAYFLTAAYNFPINTQFSVHTAVSLQSDLLRWQPEISAFLEYNNNIFGGLAFRGYDANSGDALILLAGLRISDNLSFAYSYDISVSGLRSYQSGSHELLVRYDLNKEIGRGIPPKIIYNPRHL